MENEIQKKRRRVVKELVSAHYSSPDVSIESIETITDDNQSLGEIRPTGEQRRYSGKSATRTKSIDDIIGKFSIPPNLPDVIDLTNDDDGRGCVSLWSEKYTPRSSSDLCINKQKIEQVQSQIEQMVNEETHNRIVFLSGSSGCGKSTAAKILAEEALSKKKETAKKVGLFDDISIIPERDDSGRYPNVIEYTNRTTSTSRLTSSVTQFSEFLDECKLLTMGNEKCIVVDELPNVYHEGTLMNFRKAILRWIELDSSVGLPPLIICVTEFDADDDNHWGLFTLDATFKLETVLGRNLMKLEGKGWNRVKFNPVAKRYMKQALRRVVRTEHNSLEAIPKRLITDEIDQLSSTGDIRNSLITLEYWCRFLYPVTHDASSLSVLGKENGLNIFHSIGKIIYGTQHPQEEFNNYLKTANVVQFDKSQSPPTLRDINTISVDNVSQDSASSVGKLNLNVLENYLVLNPSKIDFNVADLVDILSQADTLFRFKNDRRALTMLTYYSCFGARLKCVRLKSNGDSSGATHHRSRYSRDSKVGYKKRKIVDLVKDFELRRCNRLVSLGQYSHLSNQDAILIDGYYQNEILNSSKARNKLGNQYTGTFKRLGGDFKNIILPDTEFQPDIVEDDSTKSATSLEAKYFNVYNEDESMVEDDDKEFDEDPIVDSEDVTSQYSEDSFSDDSLVMKL
ncbi:hypothetical protein FOA43_000811 [Brettanomyces nanus]|uniref:Checkpoint protein RAD24-like helical bundle domain-containing protein n=1 Tax=Eeniella nana TaxID=13502 RepID=A0A875RND2_EENNA|nr:uncharacterized protein FOA43_000811 [Brettanomyces nanus]QPG73500.1 hypothetical protein FOA43_000811 [Brettanomyces nanus]